MVDYHQSCADELINEYEFSSISQVHTTMKRDWMTKNIKKKGAMDKEYYNTFVACKGKCRVQIWTISDAITVSFACLFCLFSGKLAN